MKKDLIKIFNFIEDACPWFMINGPTISSKTWQKVGLDLNDLIQSKGEETVPGTGFSYWGLIRDIIDNAENDEEHKQFLSVPEYCLQESRPPSCALSRTSPLPSNPFTLIDMSEASAEGKTDPQTSTGPLCPPSVPLIYPILPPSYGDPLSAAE